MQQDLRDRLVGAGLLLSAPAVFGAFMLAAPRLQGPWEALILVPTLWPIFAVFFGSARIARGFGIPLPYLVAAVVYVGIGFAYLLVRRDHLMPDAAVPLLWPSLLLWQDLCRLGVWGCPAG